MKKIILFCTILATLIVWNGCSAGSSAGANCDGSWGGTEEYKDVPLSNSCHTSSADGLGRSGTSPGAAGVFVTDTAIYTATYDGLSISTDGGKNFTNRTTTNGLGSMLVNDVFVSGNNVYAATVGGISISLNSGNSFTNKTTTGNSVYCIYASNSVIYAGTAGGLYISNDSGATWAVKTTADGLGDNSVFSIYAKDNEVYAGTRNGLSISINGGISFTNKIVQSNLVEVYGVSVNGSTIFVSTRHGLFNSNNAGTTFVNLNLPTISGFSSVDIFNSVIYAGTNYDGLFISADNGVSWIQKTKANTVYANNGTATVGKVMGVFVKSNIVFVATSVALFANVQ